MNIVGRIALLIVFFINSSYSGNATKKKSANTVEKKSAIVIDYTNGKKVLFADKADDARYPASLTKMMTIYLLFEAIKQKKISFNTKFKVSKFATQQPPSRLGLKIGEQISVADIIKALLVKSANDVAVVAAEGLCGTVEEFCKNMNAQCKKLGLKNTHFENSSGLPNKKQVTSARDMAKLGMALYKNFPQYWHYFSSKTFTHNKQTHNTHCKILRWYKGADGAKTGYIYASGFNLMVTAAKYNKIGKQKRVFVVVMGGETSKARDMYAAKLMDKYLQTFDSTITSKPSNKQAKKSLMQQVSKSEMIESVVCYDEEIKIGDPKKSAKAYQKYIDDLYKNDDELVKEIDEIEIGKAK